MSKQRAKDRAAREAAAARAAAAGAAAAGAAAARAAAAGKRPASSADPRKRPASQHTSGKRPHGKQPVYRQRRFPPLPWQLKLLLALGWLTVLALSLYLIPRWSGRLGMMVITTFALPLIVVIVRDPSRRTR